jgi:uncharacterized protein (DUF1810 family)
VRSNRFLGRLAVKDPYHLQRFIDAQNPVYEQACTELRSGRKESHWMWFIFPQLRGLGSSPTATTFGISSREEAEAYLAHPVLGSRLRDCAILVNEVEGRSAEQIFGYPDVLKFRSSMTLFASITPDNQLFTRALQKYFDGEPDRRTLEQL